jgi:hypothetical protein
MFAEDGVCLLSIPFGVVKVVHIFEASKPMGYERIAIFIYLL